MKDEGERQRRRTTTCVIEPTTTGRPPSGVSRKTSTGKRPVDKKVANSYPARERTKQHEKFEPLELDWERIETVVASLETSAKRDRTRAGVFHAVAVSSLLVGASIVTVMAATLATPATILFSVLASPFVIMFGAFYRSARAYEGNARYFVRLGGSIRTNLLVVQSSNQLDRQVLLRVLDGLTAQTQFDARRATSEQRTLRNELMDVVQRGLKQLNRE